MTERYNAHYEALVNEGIPPELAAKAAEVTAYETGERPRTTEQQQVVTEAWHYLQKKSPEVKPSGEEG
ncbi:hypothetical protein NOS3756_27270 [Nostoc sp. NIES-3756]|uniref:hypothetical protein n=1 Tax=Nostoc sp. NIES-3756 TaxID=1751286 RepID=UPI000721FFC0|nr:hypothetical protein [Nostoc sp. NIES-3756]BAT53764.1 hypothetical protein NOS3756_27270 [Nostoc sp. NIES-3756]